VDKVHICFSTGSDLSSLLWFGWSKREGWQRARGKGKRESGVGECGNKSGRVRVECDKVSRVCEKRERAEQSREKERLGLSGCAVEAGGRNGQGRERQADLARDEQAKQTKAGSVKKKKRGTKGESSQGGRPAQQPNWLREPSHGLCGLCALAKLSRSQGDQWVITDQPKRTRTNQLPGLILLWRRMRGKTEHKRAQAGLMDCEDRVADARAGFTTVVS